MLKVAANPAPSMFMGLNRGIVPTEDIKSMFTIDNTTSIGKRYI
jgi:hypothetical protein